jgi:hypothetical protein
MGSLDGALEDPVNRIALRAGSPQNRISEDVKSKECDQDGHDQHLLGSARIRAWQRRNQSSLAVIIFGREGS